MRKQRIIKKQYNSRRCLVCGLGNDFGLKAAFYELDSGELLLSDGTVAVEGRGRYLKMDLDKIADFDHDEQDWRVVPSADDPEFVEL